MGARRGGADGGRGSYGTPTGTDALLSVLPLPRAELGEVRKEIGVILRDPKGTPKRIGEGSQLLRDFVTVMVAGHRGGSSVPGGVGGRDGGKGRESLTEA